MTNEKTLELDKIYCIDCLEGMKQIDDNMIDACVTDPPYELGFMGKGWDATGIAYNKEMWLETLRILKPGAHLLSFGGSRTYHRMACAIEDAGFEIRDQIQYVYGSGFPKSLNILKQMEKKYGTKPKPKYCLRLMWETDISQTKSIKEKQGKVLQSELQEQNLYQSMQGGKSQEGSENGKKPCVEGRCNIQATEGELQKCKICSLSERISENGEERWLCYGTPFAYGTEHWSDTPENRSCPSYRPQSSEQPDKQSNAIPHKTSPQEIRRWEGWGTALKPAHEPIVMARKPLSEPNVAQNVLKWGTGGLNIDGCRIGAEKIKIGGQGNDNMFHGNFSGNISNPERLGRFPANFIHDGSDEVLELFPNANGTGGLKPHKKQADLFPEKENRDRFNYSDNGSASRFFYCAKASKKERDMGCDGLPDKKWTLQGRAGLEGRKRLDGCEAPLKSGGISKNNHPTVKPIALMEYLIKLVTKENQIVIDPFLGSGTTAVACKNLNRRFIGFEKDACYFEIANKRINSIPKRIDEFV